jgi:hypothetical protein
MPLTSLRPGNRWKGTGRAPHCSECSRSCAGERSRAAMPASEKQQKAQRDFLLAIVMAVALIYMVMAAQFERFLDPLIVMFSVPLAFMETLAMRSGG